MKEEKDGKKERETGTITVFLLLCAGAVSLCFFLLINGARYLLAAENLESALESAAASLLSRYDRDLMLELGIFALPESAATQAEARLFLEENLNQGAFFGAPACLSFTWSLTEGDRLSQAGELGRQLVSSQKVEGWLTLAKRLLRFIKVDELRRGLKLLEGVEGAADADGAADGLSRPEEDAREEDAREPRAVEEPGRKDVSLWRFLLPAPPDGSMVNRCLPVSVKADEAAAKDRLSLEPSSWGLLFDSLEQIREEGRGISAYGDAFGEALISGILNAKDKALRVEYFLCQLDYATSAPDYERYFNKAEVEYLICGRLSSWDNLREMARRLFYIRGLLRIGPRLAGGAKEPVSAAAAIKEGLEEAVSDVERLFAGQRIEAFPGQERLTMSYQDYLRIFLLIQDSDAELARFQTLIRANLRHWRGGKAPALGSAGRWEAWPGVVGEDLLERYGTAIGLSAEIRVRLWPFGDFQIKRRAEAGYDRPFALVKEAG